jgi:NAD(P)-dependent dehydrogenase (short-subunit alcohol dehydrogenase family)
VAGIVAAGGQALAVPGDVARDDDAARAVEQTIAAFGRLDIIVNNAGIARLGTIDTFSEADWDAAFGVNVKAQFLLCRHGIPHLRAAGGGTIINIASVQAYWSHGGSFAYSASKAASVAFTRALSLDHAREGIRVVGIAPGSVRTPMLLAEARRMAPDDAEGALDSWGRAHPIGRLIEPEEIAQLALFLAGDGASALSGCTVLADGGLVAGNAGW